MKAAFDTRRFGSVELKSWYQFINRSTAPYLFNQSSDQQGDPVKQVDRVGDVVQQLAVVRQRQVRRRWRQGQPGEDSDGEIKTGRQAWPRPDGKKALRLPSPACGRGPG